MLADLKINKNNSRKLGVLETELSCLSKEAKDFRAHHLFKLLLVVHFDDKASGLLHSARACTPMIRDSMDVILRAWYCRDLFVESLVHALPLWDLFGGGMAKRMGAS